MRFGVRLPGPFFVTFGRSAKSQARRNLQVRAWERQLLAEAPMRAARRKARIGLFWLAVAVVIPIALISAAMSALLSPAIWGIVWPFLVAIGAFAYLLRPSGSLRQK